jgi:hypothetical protein
MSITFSPTLHPSEHGTDADEVYVNLANKTAAVFITNVLGLAWDSFGTINPTDVLIREDELVTMAAALDVVDPEHAIEGYWSFRVGEFLEVARWADRKGRDILWG